MKKILIPLLALALVCIQVFALAEGDEAITLEVNTAKLPLYTADDPYVAELREAAGISAEDGLPVLVIPVKKGIQVPVSVQPKTVKNKKTVFSVENPDLVKVQGNNLSGLNAGETVLTIVSEQDPTATVQYRILVIQQANRISITAAEKSVPVGQTVAMMPEFIPENTTLKQVSWSSADERIATVDENGIVTGVKRGTARIIATAKDGSNIRANISVQVVQPAEEITLSDTEVTVDTGRNLVVRATVLPSDTNDKSVVWSSSDESIATVNTQGRVTGVALGECEIICESKTTGSVQAKVLVHVQQPVQSITFGEAPVVYADETGKLTWTVEPANASNQTLQLTSSNEKILTVSADGTVTGVKPGEAFVNAVSTDGSNRRAKVKVKVYQHVTGVKMKRDTAYIDIGQTCTTGAILEPKNASNNRMTWETADSSIATVEPLKNEPHRVKITGRSVGETVVTGTTEDGGYKASIKVKIGNYDSALSLREAYVVGSGDVFLTVRNDSDLTVTSITAEVTILDVDGNPVPCNSNNGSGTFTMVYRKTLNPGSSTKESNWKYVDFELPSSTAVSTYVVKITQYQIDNDWVKTIQRKHQPTKKCPVHL